MSDTAGNPFEDVSNPLDSVEDIFSGQDWHFDRPHADELSIHISGKQGHYRLVFLWHEEHSAMQFFCEYDLEVPQERREATGRTILSINEKLWLGHFDLPEGMPSPCFRHTSLFRGWTHTSGAEHVEDLVEIALAVCETYHSVFNMLSSSLYLDDKLLKLALTDSAGEA